jgi:ketosteroid isomerase-like protein
MSRSFRAPTLAAGIAVALLVFVRIADAHDFWQVPDAFQVAEGESSSANIDSAAVTDVVSRYHAALASGDSAAALRLLTPDAIILESGGLETRDEYRKGHLPADIAFAAAVPSQRRVRQVVVGGGIGWVASTSSAQGTFRGRAVNSAGAELMVLQRTQDGWRISAIHWSSRSRRP